MKIFVEAGSFYGKRSGVGRYSLQISQELAKIRSTDDFNFFSFLKLGRKEDRDFDIIKNTRTSHIRWFPGRIFSLLMRYGVSVPVEVFGYFSKGIYIYPNFISWASVLKRKRISVVHDVAFVQYPEFIQDKNLKYLQKQLPKSLKRSDKIVAVSESTKQDLIKYFGVNSEKISVIYNAVDHEKFKISSLPKIEQIRIKYGLPVEYLLYVGNIEPRKNIIGLLKAYKSSYADHKMPLVIVGAKGWKNSENDKLIDSMSDLPIIFTDFVDDNDLPAIYSGAKIFIYPSFYEGFGIPVLEAMACGCPVICSNTSSLPEIAGQAAILVNPTDTDSLALSISSLASDSRKLQSLKEAGLIQSNKFSWHESALKLSSLIDEIG